MIDAMVSDTLFQRCTDPMISLAMLELPTDADWSFVEVSEVDSSRAELLENAGSADELLRALLDAVENTGPNEIRVGVDSRGNRWEDRRAIIQFKVSSQLYDWFFNARSGYRAQFWIGVDHGLAFNARAVEALTLLLLSRLPCEVIARRIEVTFDCSSRNERDIGTCVASRQFLHASLDPMQSKLWMAEWLYHPNGKPPSPLFISALHDAKTGPKLDIPRWRHAEHPKTKEYGEGCRAPWATSDYAWLDLKGGFVTSGGVADQEKKPRERAETLWACGWT